MNLAAATTGEGDSAGWSPPPLAIALVSVLYLCGEVWFHFELLDAASSPDTPRETLERLADLGKVLAAFGLAWAARGRGGLLRLCVLVAAFWAALLCVHTGLLASLSPSARAEAWDLATYRTAVASGLASDPAVPGDPAGRKSALANIALLAGTDRGFAERAARWRRDEAARAEKALSSGIDRSWSAYAEAIVRAENGPDVHGMAKLEKGRARFRAESRTALAPDLFRENRRIGFRNVTGMKPDPDIVSSFARHVRGIGLDAFMRGLATSRLEGRAAAERWLAATLAELPDGRVIRGGDLPAGLSRADFRQRLGGQAGEAMSAVFPFGSAAAEHPQSDLVATVVYVPPLAAAASMLGIAANAGLVLGMALGGLARRRAAFLLGLPIPLVALGVWLAVQPVRAGEGALFEVWARAEHAQRAGLSVRAFSADWLANSTSGGAEGTATAGR